jgi:hypothetical protein
MLSKGKRSLIDHVVASKVFGDPLPSEAASDAPQPPCSPAPVDGDAMLRDPDIGAGILYDQLMADVNDTDPDFATIQRDAALTAYAWRFL